MKAMIILSFNMVALLNCSIFGEIGEYDPTASTKEYEKKEKAKDRKKSRNSSSYFEKSAAGEDEV